MFDLFSAMNRFKNLAALLTGRDRTNLAPPPVLPTKHPGSKKKKLTTRQRNRRRNEMARMSRRVNARGNHVKGRHG